MVSAVVVLRSANRIRPGLVILDSNLFIVTEEGPKGQK